MASLQNWERNVGTPLPNQIPGIIRFLGYVPIKHDGSIGDKLRWLRVIAGWTQDDWGEAAGVSPGTIGRWEVDRGTQGSPIIAAAIKTLSIHLEASGLRSLAAPELVSVQTSDFRGP